MDQPIDDRTQDAAARDRLLAQAGLSPARGCTALTGGGNNRAYRVWTDSGAVLLKVYFRHPADPRDRLGTEFTFSRFAWQHGIRRVPEPLAADPQLGLGLYEFVAGQPIVPEEIDAAVVEQALDFYRQLNELRHQPEAGKLPVASEACFSLRDHLRCVERRMENLQRWEPRSSLDQQAAVLVRSVMAPLWRELREQTTEAAQRPQVVLDDQMPAHSRRLSPSDFGFHNALRESSGQVRFLDFEYAGWDDPAKLACDFFCQPAVPVPERFWESFVAGLTRDGPDPAHERQRIELLLPVYRLKWACIMLNDFLATGESRRGFARPGLEPDQRKATQLDKARQALAKIGAAARAA